MTTTRTENPLPPPTRAPRRAVKVYWETCPFIDQQIGVAELVTERPRVQILPANRRMH